MGGARVDGEKLAGLLELVASEIQHTKEVSFPSMHRHVIYDGFLLPAVRRLLDEAAFPRLDDYDGMLASKDPRNAIRKRYDEETAHVTTSKLVDEAKMLLIEKLSTQWQHLVDLNEVYGDQIQETIEETREVELRKESSSVNGIGLLSRVLVNRSILRVESRHATHRKRGGTPEFTVWVDTNTLKTVFVENAFEDLGSLPVLRGTLFERSRIIRKILTAGTDRQQQRSVVLKDCHLVWWENKQGQDLAAKGCLNLVVQHAIVEKLPNSQHCFVIKPAQSAGWVDCSSFSGDKRRPFVFDAEHCEVSRDVWVSSLSSHINLGRRILDQIGMERAVSEIGIDRPTLSQVIQS